MGKKKARRQDKAEENIIDIILNVPPKETIPLTGIIKGIKPQPIEPPIILTPTQQLISLIYDLLGLPPNERDALLDYLGIDPKVALERLQKAIRWLNLKV